MTRSLLARATVLAALVATALVGGASNAAGPVGGPVPADQGGRVLGWGYDESGSTVPPSTLVGHNVIAVAAGLHFSLALTQGGHVFPWGVSNYGTRAVPTGHHYVAIAAGVTHALALTAHGQVVAWGQNDSGQTVVPASLNGKTVTAIAAGRYTSLALTSDGKVTVWGFDEFHRMAPPASLDGKTVVAIAASNSHALALTSDGKVTAWGSNGRGESTVPSTLDGQQVTAVATGGFTSLALTSTGNVVAWGTNDYRQLSVPSSVDGKAVAIAAGYSAVGAVTNDGKVVMWGEPMPNGWVADGKYITALAIGSDSHVLAVARNLHPVSAPTLGAAHVGQPIHAHHGSWTDPVSTYHYTWRVDGHVAGNGASFTPLPVHYGKPLTLTVGATATDTEQGTAHVTTAPVTVGLGTFLTVPPPTVIGKREAGYPLTASLTGADPHPDSVSFVWKRNGVVVHHGERYYPTEDDVRRSLGVYATVKKHGYHDGQSLVGTGPIQPCSRAC